MKWLVGSLALLVLAWTFNLGLLVFAAYAVFGLLLVSRLLSYAWTRQLVAERAASLSSGEIGDVLQVTVTVANRGRLRIPWLLLEDSVPPADLSVQPPRVQIKGARLALVQLRAGQCHSLTYEVQCHRRGYYQFGPVLAETGDLFGLHRTYRILTEPHFVMIYPKVLPLEAYDIESARPIGEIRLAHRLFEDPTLISGVRAFEHGDPINRIHWRASARMGLLQSKTFEPSCVAGATLLLDFQEEVFAPRTRVYASELAVSLTATIAQAILALGQQVGLLSNGRDAADRMKFQGWELTFKTREFARKGLAAQLENRRLTPVSVETRRDAVQFERILETLARLELNPEFTFAEMLDEAGPRLPRSATALAILSRVSTETAAALGNLKRRGYSVLAVIVNFGEPEHPNWAAPPDWAALLLEQSVPFYVVGDETSAARFCSERFC